MTLQRFRTTLDAAEAERREINEARFTSLGRMILRNAQVTENGFVFSQTSEPARNHHAEARCIALSRMGLAASGNGVWLLRPDTEQILRVMQQAADRQKTLFAHGELPPDQRLTFEVVDWSRLSSVEGRVLVHGEDEHSGKRFLILEATSATILYIPYTPEMEEIAAVGNEDELVR